MRILLTILFALSLFTGYAQYQLPMNGTITVSGCSGTMADPGGANNYPTNTNSNLILLPTAGSYIKLDFTSFETEKSWDYVEIYDGPTSNPGSNLIDEYSGTLQPFSVTASNSSGALFIRFRSDNSTTMAGFSANISCVTSPGSSLILNDTYLSFSGVDYEEIGIKSNSSWVVSGLPNWLTINTLSGFGNATLSMTSIQNITTTGRSAVVTVSGSGLIKTFEVYQSALDPLNFSAAKMLEAAASSIKITYEADNYSWSLFSKPDWINVSTFSGTANSAGTITITSLINTGENRKGIIKFNNCFKTSEISTKHFP